MYHQHLITIVHNQHYLNRYIKFIDSLTNQIIPDGTYTETHHICPKATDMFPQFKDIQKFSWNSIVLTARQHIIAHVLLWKAYPNIQSTGLALYYFFIQNSYTNQTLWNRVIPKSIEIRYAAKAREAYNEYRKGKGCFTDGDEIFFLDNQDPLIQELGLVGHRKGTKHSDEVRARMSATKAINKVIPMYFLDMRTTVRINFEEFDAMLSQGWSTTKTEDDYEYCNQLGRDRRHIAAVGKCDYMYRDGKFYGKLCMTDPIIDQLDLVYYITENKTKSAANAAVFAKEANIGTQWYNNGLINKKFKEDPGEGWSLGQINITDESKKKRAEGSIKAIKGKQTYNDGVKNFFVGPDEPIDPSWIKGMKPQKKRDAGIQIGATVWTDGIKTYRIYPGQLPNPSWVRGMAKRK